MNIHFSYAEEEIPFYIFIEWKIKMWIRIVNVTGMEMNKEKGGK